MKRFVSDIVVLHTDFGLYNVSVYQPTVRLRPSGLWLRVGCEDHPVRWWRARGQLDWILSVHKKEFTRSGLARQRRAIRAALDIAKILEGVNKPEKKKGGHDDKK